MNKNPLIAYMEQRDRLSAEEREVIESCVHDVVELPAGADIVQEGARPTRSCLMLSGLSARYHLMSDGGRQISAFHIAGDFIDLHSLLLGRMDHAVGAITPVRIATVPHEYLRGLTNTHPHLTRLFWLSTLIDAAIHRRWLMANGGLDSVGRVAHLVCEMYSRMRVVGLCEGNSFRLPISQNVLADAVGLSVVHVNRTVQRLRRTRYLHWQGDMVEILDFDGLAGLAEFDPSYLNLEPEAR